MQMLKKNHQNDNIHEYYDNADNDADDEITNIRIQDNYEYDIC